MAFPVAWCVKGRDFYFDGVVGKFAEVAPLGPFC